jgi:TonB-dependent starch-binding outer membrane protein SusC
MTRYASFAGGVKAQALVGSSTPCSGLDINPGGRVRSFLVRGVAVVALGFAPTVLVAQTREITGTVMVQATNQPIPDAIITITGQAAGARSNERGQFRFTVPAGDVSLMVRALGYKRQVKAVTAAQSAVAFELERDVLQLEQVVVTGQSTTLEKRNATTATSVVSSVEVNRAPAPSIESALQGKIVGASINMNSGQPGGGGQIQIRGVTSILGNGEPLYVMDGIVMSNNANSIGLNAVTRAGGGIGGTQDGVVNRLADLNPNEIESIEILKSAAASAMYGARATNGVVVIRTKRGQAGRTRVNLNAKVGTQSPLRTVGQRRYTSLEQALASAPAQGGDPAAIRALWANGTPAYHDFQKELYSNEDPSYEGVVSMSGGSDRTQYFASATDKLEQGIGINTSSRLQAVRLNLDQQFGTKFHASLGANITRHLNRRGLSNNDNTGLSPSYIFGYTPSYFDLDRRDSTGKYVKNPFNGTSSSNPFETFSYLKADEDTYRQFANANFTYTALTTAKHGLNLNYIVGMDRYQQDGQVFSPGFLQYEPNDGLIGESVQSNVNTRNLNSTLNAVWTYSPGWTFLGTTTTSVGADVAEQLQNVYRLRGRGLIPGVSIASQGQQSAEQTKTLFRDQAVFANTDLRLFTDRLTISAGFRGERSSADGDIEKWYTYPRLSASYVFEKPFSGVDNFKLRGGYGETGNRPRYGDRDVVLNAGANIEGRTTLVAATTVGNPNIKPERLNETEFGFDASFIGERLSVEGTYYSRILTDQLLQPVVANTTGLNALIVNAGELTNKGYEAALTAVPISTRDLTWTSRATYQKNKQEIKNLPKFVPPFAAPNSFGASYGRNYIVTGGPTTAIWGNAPVELDAAGKVVRILPKGAYLTMPNVTKTQRDTIIGDAAPDFQMFFSNQLQYRRFQFSVLFDWRKGGDVASMTKSLYDEGENSRDYDAPSPVKGLTLGEYRYQAWNAGRDTRMYIDDGGFVKLRELAFTFDVPEKLYRRVPFGVTSMRLQLLGRNLATWTDYWGADPEFNNFGNQNLNRFIDLAPYPPAKQFYFGIDLGF